MAFKITMAFVRWLSRVLDASFALFNYRLAMKIIWAVSSCVSAIHAVGVGTCVRNCWSPL